MNTVFLGLGAIHKLIQNQRERCCKLYFKNFLDKEVEGGIKIRK